MDNKSDMLKSSDLKSTKQRSAVLDILKKFSQPVCAEDIYSELKKQELSVSLSTVYRTLDKLTEKGLVNKIVFSGSSKGLFELNTNVHKHYLICLGCRKIISIENCPLKDYEEKLAEETGFSIQGHRLNVYGYCPECRGK